MLLAVALAAQAPDTLLVSVELIGVGSATVEARLDADSTLELPSSAVRELLGVVLPLAWVPVPTLARAYPAVTFSWIPQRLALIITDPRRVLPASAAAYAAAMRTAHRGASYVYRPTSGAFGSLTADDSGRTLLDLGWSWRGRFAVAGDYLPAARRGFWNAAWIPVSAVNLSASGDSRVRSMTLQATRGPAWALVTWQAKRVAVDGLVALGPVALFASPTRRTYLVTLNPGQGVAVQFSRTPGNNTARVSFGQSVSPFFLPQVPPR